MAFIKSKTLKDAIYYYLVENYRIGEKVFQKNLKYIGKHEPSQELVDELKLEFNEKAIQQIIRSDLKFTPFKVSESTLARADELKKKFLSNLKSLSSKGKDQLIKRFKTGYTYHSCSIEGNTLSRAEVDLVINKDQSIDGKRLLELQEVRNHKKAIEYMISEQGDLGENFIKRLHETLMNEMLEYVEDDDEFVVGGYRCDRRYIEGADFVPVEPIVIPFEMKDLIRMYKKSKFKIHPIELASEFHLRFAIIHPFSDGNGRMARLLMNFILERAGFPMIDISVKNREDYIKALDSGKSENLTRFICNQLEDYVEKLFGNLEGMEKY